MSVSTGQRPRGHRTVCVGRELRSSLVRVPAMSGTSSEMRSRLLLGLTLEELFRPSSENLSCFSFCVLSSHCVLLGAAWLPFLMTPHMWWWGCSQSCPCFRLSQPCSLSLSPQVAFCWTHSHLSVFSWDWERQNWMQYLDVVQGVLASGGWSLSLVIGWALANASQGAGGPLCCQGMLLAPVWLAVWHKPQVLLSRPARGLPS